MAIVYRRDILAALKDAGYNTTRIRKERIMGEATVQQLRHDKLVSWATIDTICRLLDCQPGDILAYNKDG